MKYSWLNYGQQVLLCINFWDSDASWCFIGAIAKLTFTCTINVYLIVFYHIVSYLMKTGVMFTFFGWMVV